MCETHSPIRLASFQLAPTRRHGHPGHFSGGFTLIELMVVVAIIALLATIAIPAYMEYVVRAQVAEGLSLVTQSRTAVTTYYAENNAYPSGNADAGLASPSSIFGKYVSRITVGASNGHILVEFGNDANPRIASQTIELSLQNEGGSLHWSCSSGIEAKYLPPACR